MVPSLAFSSVIFSSFLSSSVYWSEADDVDVVVVVVAAAARDLDVVRVDVVVAVVELHCRGDTLGERLEGGLRMCSFVRYWFLMSPDDL